MIFDIEKVTSIHQINSFRQRIRTEFGKVISNFTVFSEEVQKWIDNNEVFSLDHRNIVFIIHSGSRVNEVFFLADNYNTVDDSLINNETLNGKPLVLEIVSRDPESPIKKASILTLNRMSSSIIPPYNESKIKCCESANLRDISEIENILVKSFNPIAERIPSRKDLENILQNQRKGGIWIVKNENYIEGLMIYSIEGVSIHLRYWWTDPVKRGSGVGSCLLNKFFHLAQCSKRMILWVDKDNADAISKYRHYGFSSENMYDYIYQLK